jgi:hypothetical protein
MAGSSPALLIAPRGGVDAQERQRRYAQEQGIASVELGQLHGAGGAAAGCVGVGCQDAIHGDVGSDQQTEDRSQNTPGRVVGHRAEHSTLLAAGGAGG